MQTKSRTYRKDHMLALPAAKPQGKSRERGREAGEIEKRQLSEHHVPTTEASTHHAPCPSPQRPPQPHAAQVAPQGLVECPPTDASSCGIPTFFGGGGETNSRHPEQWLEFLLCL